MKVYRIHKSKKGKTYKRGKRLLKARKPLPSS